MTEDEWIRDARPRPPQYFLGHASITNTVRDTGKPALAGKQLMREPCG
jgi:hypothetical protein